MGAVAVDDDPGKRRQAFKAFLGAILIFICFVLNFLSFAAPFWVHSHTEFYDEGLWGKCFFDSTNSGRQGCRWAWQFNWALERSHPAWIKACQALFGIGILVILIAFVIACADICCTLHKFIAYTKGKRERMFIIVGVVMLLAALLVGFAVSIFGGLAWRWKDTSIHSAVATFGWAFHIGIASLVLNFITAFFYLFNHTTEWYYKRADKLRRGYLREKI